MKSKFIGYVEGYICTTDIDSHGDKLTRETIESIKDQIERDPTLRTMYLRHDKSQPCGEILELRIDTKGEWKGLWAKTGIYKNRKDVLEMIENKELTGFSIAGRVLEEQRSEAYGEEDLMYKFDLEVDSGLKWEVKDLLDKESLKSEVYIQKALEISAVISVVANGLFIIDKLYEYWRNCRRQGRDIAIFNIVIGDQKFNFNQNSAGDIKKHLVAQEGTISGAQKLDVDIREIGKYYTFINREDIVTFLKPNKSLVKILKDVNGEIKRVFGKDIHLYLELHRDPEEDFEGLFIVIKTNLSPEESLNLLDRLDEEWWLHVDDDVSNILEIMVRPT